ncbi:hypothetical protein Q9R19_03850 [Microbacterium sp. ARD32]|uniref:hypothetical protein n=1 Tax=Microbacterium sp. ARD32 TaxID=2962577 RepID=UPI0028822E91|nr:hypothetical protein [Microbacterium sp. ARD32]MDT0156755.1 hypothetical protein [Microbacterium sp. ARD32]
MNAVVLTVTGLISGEPLAELPSGVRIRQITAAGETDDPDVLVIGLPNGPLARWARRLHDRSRSSVALRMLLRISPLDAGASFWRAVRRDARVPGFLAGTDLLIAGERDANFTTWQLARRTGLPAVSGYAAGRTELIGTGAS